MREHMPHYYFHIRDKDLLREDPEGEEHATLELAIEEAKGAARDLLAEKLRRGDVIDGQVFEIADEQGVVVASVPFKQVLRVE